MWRVGDGGGGGGGVFVGSGQNQGSFVACDDDAHKGSGADTQFGLK